MKKDVLFLIAGLLANVQSVATSFETVWVRDVTTQFEADKRALGDLYLPDQLTFDLIRGSDELTLNLKRNYDIDPNADIYVVQKLKDGRSFLARTNKLEKEAVAYYQDIENEAFMTVRCAQRSNQNCDRIINGNIRIGGSYYDLRQAESDLTSSDMSEVPSLIGKRYVLLDQSSIEQDNVMENNVVDNAIEGNLEEELKAHHVCPFDIRLSRKEAEVHDKRTNDKTRQRRQEYFVKVAVLIDSGVFDFYASRVHLTDSVRKRDEVKQKIKEAYSHVMNGVNLRYKTIDDPGISISVILHNFIFFQNETHFPHKRSNVVIVKGKKYIDAKSYVEDLYDWDKTIGVNVLPAFDHALLITKHNLYEGNINKTSIGGLSYYGGVCDVGARTSVIETRHYVRTMMLATHELGHGLGAHHDGEGDSTSCKSEDLFIMTSCKPRSNKDAPYSRNPWIFSNCSVESFKKKLIQKDCVKNTGLVYNLDEWNTFMQKQAGDVFTPNEQCYLLYGFGSVYCGTIPGEICHTLRCRNPRTGICKTKYISGPRGTECGKEMWCIEGRCVPKSLK